MSTVLWANSLIEGNVESDQADKYALFKHLDKLDKLCRSAGLRPLSEICDSTDAKYNLDEIELPAGMASTDELMARDGVWIDAQAAVQLLETLLAEIKTRKTRFGLLSDSHEEVVTELGEAIEFARAAASKNARFNFAMVM
ncbi:hypothetical protein [Methylomonas sp. HYX-M1]|uniref:hypothetical protein n=1 Tax=Methylomonas sp. HYX-M1 TaxID=3139307 RepID=UPI00345B93F4